MSIVYIILTLLTVIAVLVLLLTMRSKQLKKVQKELQCMNSAFDTIKKKVERLQKAQSEDKKITEEANEKRNTLKGTRDDSLVTRANSLFSNGVPDGTGCSTSGH